MEFELPVTQKPKANLAWIDATCLNVGLGLKQLSSVVLSPLGLCILHPQVAKSNPGNWFNMNPIHCLRSRCAAACSSFVQPAVCSVRGTCTSTTHLAFSIRWERPPAAHSHWHTGTMASKFEERHDGCTSGALAGTKPKAWLVLQRSRVEQCQGLGPWYALAAKQMGTAVLRGPTCVLNQEQPSTFVELTQLGP